MATLWILCLQRFLLPLFATRGVHSSFQGSGSLPDGPGAIVLFTIMGAFCGLVTGLVLLPVVRYVAFLAGRNFAGGSWLVVGSVVGAIAFLAWALLGDKE